MAQFTKLELSNLALDLIGVNPIQSMTDSTRTARQVISIFDGIYRGAIEQYRPLFAQATKTLNYNFVTKGYQLPTDCQNIVSISSTDYRVQGEIIFLGDKEEQGPINIEYLSNRFDLLTDNNQLFADGLVYMLAQRFGVVISKDKNRADFTEEISIAFSRYLFNSKNFNTNTESGRIKNLNTSWGRRLR